MSTSTHSMARPAWREGWLVLGLSLVILLVTSAPYVLAYRVADGYVFGGVLLNPVDGNSYLAKMREGWRGEWLFTLPYTARPGAGAFVYTYYLALGHLARQTGASIQAVYQVARILGGLALLSAAYAFIARFIRSTRARLAAWLLYALGAGLGWLAVPFGRFTADLSVAEAFPFLSLTTNGHFALAMALLLWILLLTVPGLNARAFTAGRSPALRVALPAVGIALLTTALAQVQPLALLNVGLILAGAFAWQLWFCRGRPLAAWVRAWAPAGVFGAAALPWVVYDAALMLQHPVLSRWNAQNSTPSPPAWDAILSGGALLALALVGAVQVARHRSLQGGLLLTWLILGSLVLYAPVALQRRLSLGLWMPVTLLALDGLRSGIWPRLRPRARPLALVALGVAVLPSTMLVYAALLGAVGGRHPSAFLAQGEAAALDWLAGHAGSSIVAASPSLSNFVPAHSDARVIYGHPFETLDAEERRQAVLAFYRGEVPAAAFVAENGVAYVVAGPRERALGTAVDSAGWSRVFEQGGVTIYAP